jgi:general secretion pathway protein C
MFFRVAVVSVLVYIAVVVTTAVHSDTWVATAAAPAASPPAPPPAPPPLPPPAPMVGVVPAAATETRVVDVRRADLKETDLISRSARIVPTLRDGVPIGYKLYAIRPGSLLAVVGFENGDTLRAINDVPLVSAERVLEVHRSLGDHDHFDVDVERRGERVRIVVLLH